MSVFFLIIIIFVVPFALALYLWRDNEPKRAVYLMCLSVSALALIMLVTGHEVIETLMPLGLFMASTSFFAGVYLSVLVRSWRKRQEVNSPDEAAAGDLEPDDND